MTRVLLLGGTTEASALARHLAAKRIDAIYSYAGRTGAPADQPLPTRVGGFGGAEGLARYLTATAITHVVDATHPFAAQMSRNAVSACQAAAVPLCAFERAPWQAGNDDAWTLVPDIAGAVAALPEEPCRIFLAIGRQNLAAFAAKSWHQYVLRLVDAPTGRLPIADAEVIVARGPFTTAGDCALMKARRINLVVAKNAGGTGARAKLDATRALKIPVIMIDRPAVPLRRSVGTIAEILAFLDHRADLGV